MSNIDKHPYHADGGDIGTGRIREIADNPYGDEEKCWLAKRVIALLDELEAAQSENERLAKMLTERNGEPVEELVKRVAELEEIATDYGMKFQRAQDALKHQSLLNKTQIEAAEKRIAELESSHSKLREAMAGIHNTITCGGAHTPLAAILNASKRAYEESAAAAGKGE